MRDEEREKLIEQMVDALSVAGGYRITPQRKQILDAHARTALAAAEPVIREQCARIARNKVLTSEDCCGATGEKIAAAIRGDKS